MNLDIRQLHTNELTWVLDLNLGHLQTPNPFLWPHEKRNILVHNHGFLSCLWSQEATLAQQLNIKPLITETSYEQCCFLFIRLIIHKFLSWKKSFNTRGPQIKYAIHYSLLSSPPPQHSPPCLPPLCCVSFFFFRFTFVCPHGLFTSSLSRALTTLCTYAHLTHLIPILCSLSQSSLTCSLARCCTPSSMCGM